mgnify:CR=1 FL=1
MLVVIIPENVKEAHKNWTFTYFTGGSNSDHADKFKPLDQDILITASLAVETGLVTSVLF